MIKLDNGENTFNLTIFEIPNVKFIHTNSTSHFIYEQKHKTNKKIHSITINSHDMHEK